MTLIRQDWCPPKKRLKPRHTQSRDHIKTEDKTAVFEPRKEALEVSTLLTP